MNYMKIIKIAIGSCVAILIANQLGLEYSASAGIITLLSIQNTKKETLAVAGRRFLSFFLAMTIAYTIFHYMGYTELAFGVFLLIFTGICFGVGMEDGVSMSAVLVSHFLTEKSMSIQWIENELVIMIIGVSIGVLLNLYIPRNHEALKRGQYEIEEDMRLMLKKMASFLIDEVRVETALLEEDFFATLDSKMEKALSRAYDYHNNTLLKEVKYNIHYMEMRTNQCGILKEIYDTMLRRKEVPKQTTVIAEFMIEIAEHFHEFNNVSGLLDRFHQIKDSMKLQDLPVTREEFESRALLYEILHDLEHFLMIKKEFIHDVEHGFNR